MINFGNVKQWKIGGNEVKQAKLNGIIVWEKKDYTIPFYVENISGSKQTLSIWQDEGSSLNITIEKSSNGATWDTLGSTGTPISYVLSRGQRLYLRADTTTWTAAGGSGIFSTHINGVSKVGGNIMSLLYGRNFTGNETSLRGSIYTFYDLFKVSGVNNPLVDAGGLILPSPRLSSHCYGGMFRGCSSLTSAPELPATILGIDCYHSMFSGCSSLTVAPILPAEELLRNCYEEMFRGCSSLNNITCIATDISKESCILYWVRDVARTGTFIKKAGVSYPSGISGIPSGWTVIEV